MRDPDRRTFLRQAVALGAVVTVGGAALVGPAQATTPTKVRKMNAAHHQDRFTTANSIVILVDHQTGTVGWVKSQPQKVTIASSRALAPTSNRLWITGWRPFNRASMTSRTVTPATSYSS